MNNPISVEVVTRAIQESGSQPVIIGFTGMAGTIALLSITTWAPTDWLSFVQWPVYGLFLLSAVVFGLGVLMKAFRD